MTEITDPTADVEAGPPFEHPETGQVLQCLGDQVKTPGCAPTERSHSAANIVLKRPTREDELLFDCPRCGGFLSTFLGLNVEDVRGSDS